MAASTLSFWRRMDTPGHDACRLSETPSGWRLEGTTVFRHESEHVPTCVHYWVDCDERWHTRQAEVHGWVGDESWDLQIEHDDAGQWLLNGAAAAGLEGCFDVDFGFTPSTNLLQLRRRPMSVGEQVDIPVAWLDLPHPSLTRMEQRYDKRTGTTYWYESSTTGYSGLLELAESGFARVYPQLWEMLE
jgi:uncharacterized protein